MQVSDYFTHIRCTPGALISHLRSPYSVLSIFLWYLLGDQDILSFPIISLMACMFDEVVRLLGEIRC